MTMHCSVYKGSRRPQTYLFVPGRDDFSAVSPSLHQTLGELIHVMDLVIYPERPLARADARTVLRSLLQRGCWVQLPPEDEDSTHVSSA